MQVPIPVGARAAAPGGPRNDKVRAASIAAGLAI